MMDELILEHNANKTIRPTYISDIVLLKYSIHKLPITRIYKISNDQFAA